MMINPRFSFRNTGKAGWWKRLGKEGRRMDGIEASIPVKASRKDKDIPKGIVFRGLADRCKEWLVSQHWVPRTPSCGERIEEMRKRKYINVQPESSRDDMHRQQQSDAPAN
jgi:hypothetical protein